MPISPYIKSIRDDIGHKLLLLPTVAVLPRDVDGRLLLVRQIDTGRWGTIGGAIDPDETPEAAAEREASEEAGVTVRLVGLLAVTGGPDYRITYPNGDEVACVSVIFEAVIDDGVPRPDYDETSEVGWFAAMTSTSTSSIGSSWRVPFRSSQRAIDAQVCPCSLSDRQQECRGERTRCESA